MNKVCTDVEVEPKLQPVNNDEARLDGDFWRPGQSAFIDIRVTNLIFCCTGPTDPNFWQIKIIITLKSLQILKIILKRSSEKFERL